MTAVASSAPYEMESLQPEDTMDLASSPQIPLDAFDLDLDTVQEPFLEPIEDTMIDDSPKLQESATSALQPAVVEIFDDDEMLDEDTASQAFPDNVSDLNMESHLPTDNELGHDEDILYEDEEELKDRELTADSSGSVQFRQEGVTSENPAQAADQELEEDEANFGAIPSTLDTETAIDHDTSTSVRSSGKTNQALLFGDEAANAEGHFPSPTSIAVPTSETKQSNTQYYPADAPKTAQLPTTPGLDRLDSAEITNIADSSATISQAEEVGLPTTPNTHGTNVEGAAHDLTEHSSPSDVAVHPVKVVYQDSEISLFPPLHDDESQTFFLSDTGLAHESLEKLLASCRDVLEDTIGEDDELVLDVASMGLHISEGSKYAAEISLSQILDVYLSLSHNEHLEQVEPLYCSLSSRICLASQYAYLINAAQEGKSLTEISAEHFGILEENTIIEQQAESLESTFDSATHQDDVYHEVARTTAEERGHAEDSNHNDEVPANDDEVGYDQYDPDPNLEETSGNAERTINREESGEEATGINPTGYEELDQTEASAVEAGLLVGTEAKDHAAQMQHSVAEDSIDLHTLPNIHNDLRQVSAEYDQEHQLTEDQAETASFQGETASSHTVEGENGINEDDFLNENDLDSNEQLAAENDDASNEGVHHVGPLGQLDEDQNGLHSDPDDEDDLLDFDPEGETAPSPNDVQIVNNVGSANVNALEDIFASADDHATSDTLGEAATAETEGHLNGSARPITPSKDKSAKRKAVEDDDEFGLFEIETPDKKRRWPS